MRFKDVQFWMKSHRKMKYGVIAGLTFFGTFTTTCLASELAGPAPPKEQAVAEYSADEEETGSQTPAACVITYEIQGVVAPEEKAGDSQEEDIRVDQDPEGQGGTEAETGELIQADAEAEAETAEAVAETETGPAYTIGDMDQTLYVNYGVNVRSGPGTEFEAIGYLAYASQVTVTGQCVENGWYRIDYEGATGYITSKYACGEEPAARPSSGSSSPSSSTWTGSVLTKSKGVNYGPSGKETYYNLDMSGVVSVMRGMGNNDEYWVRSDGCKMLGDYIMVAANLNVHPRGSLVETSLGTGIVCDTGGFASSNPTQLDIATNW